MIIVAIRLMKAVGLAALIVFPAHSQNLSALDRAVAITTFLQFITEEPGQDDDTTGGDDEKTVSTPSRQSP